MMCSCKQKLLEDMVRSGKAKMQWGPILDTQPPPLGDNFAFSKVEGMMLGLAIGDAIGVTTEAMLPENRQRAHGEIRDYLPNRYTGEPIGFPSDDSQLAFWTLEQLMADKDFVPENVGSCFCGKKIFGIGRTVRRFLANRDRGLHWDQSGVASAGNGALMRIAPMLIPYLRSPSCDLWVDTALSTIITHNDPGSTAACVAFINILWRVLGMERPPGRDWWLKTYVQVAQQIEGEPAYRPRNSRYGSYEGPIWRFAEERIATASAANMSTVDACNDWYSGAFLLETVPSVLYILM